MSITSKPKQTTSIKLDHNTKEALAQFAKQENRSIHYMLVTAVEEFVKRKQEEAEYNQYIKERVTKALHRLETEGSNGIPSEQVLETIIKRMANKKTIPNN